MSVLAVLFGQLPGDSLLWGELQNTGHTPLFGVIALATLGILRNVHPIAGNRPLVGYSMAGIASLAVAFLSEFGQLLTHRDPSVSDMIRDLTGITVGLGIAAGFDPRMKPFWHKQRHGSRAATIVLSGCLLAASLFPLAHLATAYGQRNGAFPVVIDFKAHWSKPFLRLKHATLTRDIAPTAWTPVSGQQVARLTLNRALYPGVAMIEPFPDWSGFETLTLVIYSPLPQTFDLVLRIHDKLHNQAYEDRFNQQLTVTPGENRFRIPLLAIQDAPVGRDMDMTRITNVTLFATGIASPVNCYLGPLNLE